MFVVDRYDERVGMRCYEMKRSICEYMIDEMNNKE